jgi:hypothetical protein
MGSQGRRSATVQCRRLTATGIAWQCLRRIGWENPALMASSLAGMWDQPLIRNALHHECSVLSHLKGYWQVRKIKLHLGVRARAVVLPVSFTQLPVADPPLSTAGEPDFRTRAGVGTVVSGGFVYPQQSSPFNISYTDVRLSDTHTNTHMLNPARLLHRRLLDAKPL